MENGQTSQGAIEIIRQYVTRGEKVPAKLRDELLFGALVELFDIAQSQGREIRHHRPWVMLVKWTALTLGSAILLFLFGVLTHTITLPF
jgi:hypothetical protein